MSIITKARLLPILMMAALLLPSCKKSFLDREPYSGLPTDQSIKNVDDLETALNGAYSNLRSPNLYGRTIPLFGDLFADNVYISSINSNRYLDFFLVNIVVNNGNVTGVWQAAYNTILNANNVIHSEVASSPDVDQLRGEALCLRALMYFELVKHFSKPYTVDPNGLGVPLILSRDPFLKPARNTTAEVYAQIEKDLRDALPLLTITKSSGYFNSAAAEALLARMHQFKGEWDKALEAAENVLFNSGFALLGGGQFANYWSSNTPRNDGVETLFEVVFDLVGNAGINSLAYFYDQVGYGDALAAEGLYDLYSNDDIRKDLIVLTNRVTNNDKAVNKYPNSSQPDQDEFKVLRMSEVLLIAAESAYNLNNEALALDYLNALASQRIVNFTGYSSTGQALLNDIMLERRRELAFEGHRYWDLARYNMDVVRDDVAGNYSDLGAPLVIPATSTRRIFPIPQAELDANPIIRPQQNPGYN